MPSAQVISPSAGQTTNQRTFQWNIISIPHTASQVIVGYSSGSLDIYQGPAKAAGGQPYSDTGVNHPGNNASCHTRPRYRKPFMGNTWYTQYTLDTPFTSI